MPPILRSVVAQCYRRGGGRSIGFRQAARNFCSSPPGSSTYEPSRVRKIVSWFTLRALPAAAGYGLGAIFLGGSTAKYREKAKYEEKQLEQLRKIDEIIKENMSSDLAAAGMKPRIAFLSNRKS